MPSRTASVRIFGLIHDQRSDTRCRRDMARTRTYRWLVRMQMVRSYNSASLFPRSVRPFSPIQLTIRRHTNIGLHNQARCTCFSALSHAQFGCTGVAACIPGAKVHQAEGRVAWIAFATTHRIFPRISYRPRLGFSLCCDTFVDF